MEWENYLIFVSSTLAHAATFKNTAPCEVELRQSWSIEFSKISVRIMKLLCVPVNRNNINSNFHTKFPRFANVIAKSLKDKTAKSVDHVLN